MIPHVAISASAGSGKTFQLARRYLTLLAHEVTPDRIIALTFSRKAAGEIFDALVGQLVRASTEVKEAQAAGRDIGRPEFGPADFRRLLRSVMDHLARLHVGTLDSFTVGIVRSFPLELGLGLGLELMDNEGSAAMAARREALDRLFRLRAVGKSGARDFMEALKEATFGREEKGLERNLDAFLTDYLQYYRLAPDAGQWGDEHVIWPTGRRWPASVKDVRLRAEELVGLLGKMELPADLRESIQRFAEFAGGFDERGAWDDKVMKSAFAQRLVEQADEAAGGRLVILSRRKEIDLSGRPAELLDALLSHLLGTELNRSLRETRGLFLVLDHFERIYDEAVRRHGRLTFDDVQYLLTASHRGGGGLLSRTPGDPARLYIDFRLDSRLDHWLLDEFQDTSDLQWEALRNLADEVLQDASGQRTFFYVGDVKQAIYGWRGGNPALFGRLLARYGERIEVRPLHTSFRSAAPVLGLVNQVFGCLPEEIPPAVRERWKTLWGEHTSARELDGYACVLEPPCPDPKEKPEAVDRYRVAAALLREIEPVRRGLSAAVLARSNANVSELVSLLRAELPGVPVVQEGVSPLAENPVVALLMALPKFAAHPGDLFAWRHMEMSPLGPITTALGQDGLCRAVLHRVQEEGFQSLMRHWGGKLAEAGGLDDFGRARWESLLEAAGQFDAGGDRSVNAFLDFIENFSLREEAPGSAIRVMTIHQSKGLGFDLVILPDLQSRSLVGSSDADFAVAHDDEESPPRWALKLPRRVVAENDPVLAPELEKLDDAAAFESMCVLYVALTRAKQGLYVISSFPGASSKSLTAAAFVKSQLQIDPRSTPAADASWGGMPVTKLWDTGRRDWYASRTGTAGKAAPAPRRKRAARTAAPPRRRLLSASPSKGAEHERSGELVFAAHSRQTRGLGSAVHGLLAQFDWWTPEGWASAVKAWEGEGDWDAETRREAKAHVEAALKQPAVLAVLTRPAGETQVWREKSFDVVLQDTWVTGTFDRVVAMRGPDGRFERAEVLDFKTNMIEDDSHARQVAEEYRPQMTAYRGALAALLGLAPEKIALKLVFTRAGRVVSLD